MKVSTGVRMAILSLLCIKVSDSIASEVLISQNKNTDMIVSIYNNNLGLIRDVRQVKLQKGLNEIAFEGVAGSIQPESAVLSAKSINVLEQNYDYNLLTSNNLLDSFVGQEVKTVVQNPQTGQPIFNTAVLLSNNFGSPVLQFDYGIEANFPGRIIYKNVPQNLRVKPTLAAKIESKESNDTNLELTYLTTGLSWKADYVAEIISEDKLNLNTWITLKNETGADYANAQIQLISGNVNYASNAGSGSIRPIMMAKAVQMTNAAMDSAAEIGVSPESVSDYYMYKLPKKTTIKDKQSKQISLMKMNDVKYEKEYRLISPLYLGMGASKSEFEKKHPGIVFKLVNDKQSNLGQPLPSGMMRFYENKNGEDMLFLGENRISQTAVGEKAELNIGQAFDIYANGRIKDAKAISKDTYEYQVTITFKNSSNQPAQIVFEQNIYNNWEILKENIESVQKNASTAQWKFELPKQGKKELNYTVRVSRI